MFQHRRRFFRRRAGLLSGAHFLPERGGGGWNPQHSFLQAVLLSAAQFAGQPLLYRLLSCTQFWGACVGIPRTVYGGQGCYRQHNFGAVCIAGQKKWLLSGAQFPNCRILAAVVIDGTFLKKSTVQRTAGIVIHGTIRFFRGRAVVIRRTIRKNPFFCGASCRGLLVCAQFALQGPGLLSTAQYKDFSARVVIQRTFPRGRIFPSALLECCAHFSLFLFSRPGLLYSTLFKNPTKFSLPPFSCKKTFLPLLCSAHCCVLHICVGMLRTAPL